MFFEMIVLGIIIGLVRGGSLLELTKIDFKYIPAILSPFLIQAGIDFWGRQYSWGGYPYLHIVSYFILFYALWANLSIPGIRLVFAGSILNFLVISVNGGVMPVRADVLPGSLVTAFSAGLGGTHGLINSETHLKFLADIFYLAVPYQNQLISVGDVVINAGSIVLLVKGMEKQFRNN